MITLIPPGADGKVTLGVHDGHFHPDDVVCAALLFMAFGRERVRVVRSREEETLAKCQYVLDVGERDHVTADRVCLDHHQRDSLTRPNGVKASAAGKLMDLMFADEKDTLEEDFTGFNVLYYNERHTGHEWKKLNKELLPPSDSLFTCS